jgi:uncharacterized protein YwqG
MHVDPGVWGLVFFFGLIFVGAFGFAHLRERQRTLERQQAQARDPKATERLAARLKQLVLPTLLLVPEKGSGFSKLGGDPELPAELEWPAGETGPRSFVTQIDLASVQAQAELDWLPRTGSLYAFYDPERHGASDVVRMLYSPGLVAGEITTSPGAWRTFAERRVAFTPFSSVPSADWLNLDPTDVAIDHEQISARVAFMGTFPPQDQPQHRIGGYPDEIQSECMRLTCEHMARGLPLPRYDSEIAPEIELASNQWRLLLQIDSDPALGMNWGDGGLLYVFVREKDAMAGDFSKTVSIWQTY